MKKIYLHNNGNTTALINEEQVAELQHSWLLLYINHIKSLGYNPEDFNIVMPDGRSIGIFKINNNRYNWGFI